MNKLALFVEGYTELEFCTKLILEIAAANSVTIECRQITGGTTCRRRSQLIRTHTGDNENGHFIIVYDCGGDAAVKKRMMEEYGNLARAGYSKIICIRDVRPDFSRGEIPQLERGLPLYVRTKPIVVTFVLSVMEVEAWFLAEHTHFSKIDSMITVEAIAATLGFEPSTDDMRLRPVPSEDLDDCYAMAGQTYQKSNVKRTIDALDTMRVYFNVADRFPHLKLLCTELTSFLEQGSDT